MFARLSTITAFISRKVTYHCYVFRPDQSVYILSLKMLSDICEVFPDRKVLRAHSLALAAPDAVACLSEGERQIVVIASLRGPDLFLDFLHVGIVKGKVFGNCDMFRAVYRT